MRARIPFPMGVVVGGEVGRIVERIDLGLERRGLRYRIRDGNFKAMSSCLNRGNSWVGEEGSGQDEGVLCL